MTLIVAVTSPESIWLLADRRLSRNGRPTKDDARKVMFLETTDGVAIIGYAGLGATAHGTEPADWVSAVLRGRNLPLEQSLGVIADATKREFPRHMLGIRIPGHSMIIPAFIGKEPNLYSIDLVFARDGKSYGFRCTRHVAGEAASASRTSRTPRVMLGGSGAVYLGRHKASWWRGLLSVVGAHDRGRVSPRAVADHLAKLNDEVHRCDKSVGPRCIVAWRNRRGGVHSGGGAHQFYTGTAREANSPSLPTIGTGMDISALIDLMMPHWIEKMDAMRAGRPPPRELSNEEINAELARLPDKPDENLR